MRATMQHFMPAFAQPQPLSRPERPKSVRLQPAQMDADALETAAVLYREALAQCREKLGDRHEDTLTSINNLAMLLLAQDELEEAGQLLCEALDASRETLTAGMQGNGAHGASRLREHREATTAAR